jgi:PIN domain nuclease of toxin-antitoxin system
MILLDSHVVIWLGLHREKLSKAASGAIQKAESSGTPIAISVTTLFEIAYLLRRKRIRPSIPDQAFLAQIRGRFHVLPVDAEIAVCAGELEGTVHGDPIDRILMATAILANCALITADRKILASGVCKTLW